MYIVLISVDVSCVMRIPCICHVDFVNINGINNSRKYTEGIFYTQAEQLYLFFVSNSFTTPQTVQVQNFVRRTSYLEYASFFSGCFLSFPFIISLLRLISTNRYFNNGIVRTLTAQNFVDDEFYWFSSQENLFGLQIFIEVSSSLSEFNETFVCYYFSCPLPAFEAV